MALTRNEPRLRTAFQGIILGLAVLCLAVSLPAQPGPPPNGQAPNNAGPDQNKPLNLSARVLPRGRVRLTWLSPRRLSYQRILRADGDGEFRVIENRLPGDLQVYVDPNPGNGIRRYMVEGNGDLRSDPVSITVGTLTVRNLACNQVRGGLRIRVTWAPGDDSRRQVRLDGQVVEGLENLGPNRRWATIDVPQPGPEGRSYLVEVVTADNPNGPAARCETTVEPINPPSIGNLECSRMRGDEKKVQLNWRGNRTYAAYEIERNGIVVARTDETSWIDELPPLGAALRYSVAGLTSRGQHGPPSFCTHEFEQPPQVGLSGQVVFDDSETTPLGRGAVLVFLPGEDEAIARAAVDEEGRFKISTEELREGIEPPFDLEYRAPFLDHIRLGLLDTFEARGNQQGPQPQRLLSAFSSATAAGDDIQLRVPLPVIAVSPERSDIRRWQALHDHFRDTSEGLLIPMAATGGIVRGSLNLISEIENVRGYFLRQFGSSPRQVDMVAYGFAGLSARLYGHTSSVFELRRLILLGTPNHGTPRALVETRSDVGARPSPGGIQAPDELGYKAADEQTSRFLELYNERITHSRATTLYLLAGSGGRGELDDVLDCTAHDGRVCLDSALGRDLDKGIFTNPKRFILSSDHNRLGRDAESLELLASRLGLGRVLGDEEEEAAGDAGQGGGAGAGGSSMALGKVGQGEIVPGGGRQIPFASDTSGSIIIILNSEDKGPLEFRLRTPSMGEEEPEITGENAAEYGFIYESYNDGEGTNVQFFKTGAGEFGTYIGKISNPGNNPAIKYTVEFYLEHAAYLSSELDGYDIPLGSTPMLTTHLEQPELVPDGVEITQNARLFYPDGSLALIELNDEGGGGDVLAGDGIYSSALPESTQPGYYIVEIDASSTDGESFQRADTLQFLVRSDLATLGNDYASGADNVEAQGDGGGAGNGALKDNLWVQGDLQANRGGDLVVLGTLVDLDGNTITQAGSLYSLESADAGVEFQLNFDGYEIFGSQADGPYRLTNVEIIDAGVGFIRADLADDVHTTGDYAWSDFSLSGGLLFLRGDSNNDHAVDISDSINLLAHLFVDSDTPLTCLDAADANADGAIDLSDAISIFSYLFLGQGGIPLPYPECGQKENLGCDYYPYCR